MFPNIVLFDLLITCVFFENVHTTSAMESLNRFIGLGITTTRPNDQNTDRHQFDRNHLENIELRELLETLQNKLNQKQKNVPETTNIPSTLVNMIHELDNSKNANNEVSSKIQAVQLATLNTVYDKVSENIKVIHEAIQKNFDEIMKLNILKGMLMEENIRSKGAGPTIKYMSKYKDLYLQNKY